MRSRPIVGDDTDRVALETLPPGGPQRDRGPVAGGQSAGRAALPGGRTEAEYKLAAAAARGISLRQVAEETGWTYDSVKVYLPTRVYRKLGVHNQAELVRWWITNVENRGDCNTCILRT